jgi:hypothetical protein
MYIFCALDIYLLQTQQTALFFTITVKYYNTHIYVCVCVCIYIYIYCQEKCLVGIVCNKYMQTHFKHVTEIILIVINSRWACSGV